MNLEELKIVPQFDKNAVCCFTGNRPHKLPWGEDESDLRCKAAKRHIEQTVSELAESGITLFVSGMAKGGDTYFAEAVLKLKESKPVFLECAVPCPEQTNGWSEADKRRYGKILAASDYVTYVSPSYTRSCMFKRNIYMAEKSSVIITLDYETSGGTAQTVAYAKKLGLKIIPINS